MEENQLNDEDMARVKKYLDTPVASVDRKPFRPLKLLAVLLVIVSFFSVVSIFFARMAGVE